MKFSFEWLKKYLNTSKSINEIAKILTSIGLEVEEVVDFNKRFEGFQIVLVDEVAPHPNADRLRTCNVLLCDGSRRDIVCGASNLRNGMKAVLALPGAIIPSTGSTLKSGKVRGCLSDGMLCSYEELDMKDKDNGGIIELPGETLLCSDVSEALGLGEGTLDVSITPNRGDCFSIKGIARDLATAEAGELIAFHTIPVKPSFDFPLKIGVDNIDYPIAKNNMSFAAFQVIRDIKNIESPVWLKNFLSSANLNSISSVVDFANFMAFDCGRPFHVYDLDKISKQLTIRQGTAKERFTDIKGDVHLLNSDITVLSDDNDILCLLGIMGGKSCACDSNTKNVLIESAVFNPAYISNIGARLNIISDSRTRFERGVDPALTVSALEELTSMIISHCGGSVSTVFKLGSLEVRRKTVTISEERLNKMAGYNLDFSEAIKILERLGIKVRQKKSNSADCEIPSFRFDIEREEDLIEEILRITGYDNVPITPLFSQYTGKDKVLDKYRKITSIKMAACANGLSELMSFGFANSKSATLFQSKLLPWSEENVSLINPISLELSVMKNSLYPDLLVNTSNALKFSCKSVNLFEVSSVFSLQNRQQLCIYATRSGKYNERNWIDQLRDSDVFDIKCDLLNIMDALGISMRKIVLDTNENDIPHWYHTTRSASVRLGKKIIGYFGELHPNILKAFDISVRTVGFELCLEGLLDIQEQQVNKLVGKVFQPVERDFSFVLQGDYASRFKSQDIMKVLLNVDPLIKKVSLFDYYKIDDNSVAFGISVVLQSPKGTLNDLQIRAISEKIIGTAASIGCELRQ